MRPALREKILNALARPNGADLVDRWAFRRDLLLTALVRGQFGSLPHSSTIRWPFHIGLGLERVFIGEEVVLNSGCALGTGKDGVIRIGDRTGVSGMLGIWAEESVTIGKNVLLARGVQIHDSRHSTDDRDTPIQRQGMTGTQPVEVRDGAWIGAQAVILSGVTIGQNAVVGANSVVTSDVPDFATAVGVPARVL